MTRADGQALEHFRIEPEHLSTATERGQPIGFIDIASLEQTGVRRSMPPFPLIGLGESTSSIAAMLDAVVEPPISASALISQTSKSPRAAAVLVQLLRSIEEMPPSSALPLESMAYAMLQGSDEHGEWLSARRQSAPHAPGHVRVERSADLLFVTLDRPADRNAIDSMMLDQLFEAFSLAALDDEISEVRLAGAGPCFSIGGDLREFGTTRDPSTAHLIRSRTMPALPASRCMKKLSVHVHGACIGAGLELAAFGQRITASRDAWFQLPELALGLIPGAGGCVSVPRRIGRRRAALMILSGRRIDAGTALRWGLIDAIEDDVPRGPSHADAVLAQP